MAVSRLHIRMVKASKRASPLQLVTGDDLNHLPLDTKPRRIPDLHLGEDIAIESLTFGHLDGKLGLFGYTYKHLAVVIPIPDNVTEIWLYDPATDEITDKFRRDMNKLNVLSVQLECWKCGYRWAPRVRGMPRMCPQCKSRDWNKAPKKRRK